MTLTYQDLGWSSHFADQPVDDTSLTRHRISEVHRDRLTGLSPQGEVKLLTPHASTGDFAVGDWVLADDELRVQHLLERQTLLHRRAAGTDARVQLIAANVDTLFIVTACNDDFNIARLERYLALAAEAGSFAVIVLTKIDLCDDPETYRAEAAKLAPKTPVELVNAFDPDDIDRIMQWCPAGKTAALLGSSGVGKTTITNGLTLRDDATGDVRKGDAKGRHVTTSRTLRRMQNGGWIIDTPGMRALRLQDAAEGIDDLFDDLTELAQGCRFSDCEHTHEPGCRIREAIENGTVDPARVARWHKLKSEDLRNSETIAEGRAKARSFGKMVSRAMKDADRRKNR